MWPEDELSPVTMPGAPLPTGPTKGHWKPTGDGGPPTPSQAHVQPRGSPSTVRFIHRARRDPPGLRALPPGPRLWPRSPPPTLPSLECGNHVVCYSPWYPHRPPKGAMPNVAW